MKLIFITTLVIGFLLLSIPSQANYIFLDSYKFTVPNHLVYKIIDGNTCQCGSFINLPSFKINDVYFEIKNKIITAMMMFSGPAVLNSSIKYSYSITFPLNYTYDITFGFNKDSTMKSNNTTYSVIQEWTIYYDGSQTAISAVNRLQGNCKIYVSGNEIYWKLNTSQFYDNLNLGKLFIQDTFANRFQYQFQPAYQVSIQNIYYIQGTLTIIEDNQQGTQGTYNYASTFKSLVEYSALTAAVLILIPLTIKRLRRRRQEKIRRAIFKEKVRSGKYNF